MPPASPESARGRNSRTLARPRYAPLVTDQGPKPRTEPVSIWVPIKVAVIAAVVTGIVALAIEIALAHAGVST